MGLPAASQPRYPPARDSTLLKHICCRDSAARAERPPVRQESTRLASRTVSSGANLVLYCRTGGRSALAAESLQQMGFSNVESLAGGYLGWEAAGKPIRQT